MPLTQKLHSSSDMTERAHDASLQVQVKDSDSVRDDKETFPDFEEDECMDSNMEDSTLRRSRQKQPTRSAPNLPQRSDKRTSKLLNDVMLELQNLDGSQQKGLDKASVIQESDPLELYLSSEEDASISDDDDDSSLLDLDLDLDAIETEIMGAEQVATSQAPGRKSQDTARVVSMTFVKPQIITIVSTSTSNSATSSPIIARNSVELETPASSTTLSSSPPPSKREQQGLPLKRRSKSIHRMSISSIASLAYSSSSSITPTNQSPSQLPPRKSSRLAALTSLVTGKPIPQTSSSHAFLNTDPFPTQQQSEQVEPEPEPPKTPVSAFKKGLTRGLARRRPSMQRLSEVYAAQNASYASLPLAPEPETMIEKKPEGPVRYQDIMKSVVRAPPSRPLSPKAHTSNIFAARRKSLSLSMRY